MLAHSEPTSQPVIDRRARENAGGEAADSAPHSSSTRREARRGEQRRRNTHPVQRATTGEAIVCPPRGGVFWMLLLVLWRRAFSSAMLQRRILCRSRKQAGRRLRRADGQARSAQPAERPGRGWVARKQRTGFSRQCTANARWQRLWLGTSERASCVGGPARVRRASACWAGRCESNKSSIRHNGQWWARRRQPGAGAVCMDGCT